MQIPLIDLKAQYQTIRDEVLAAIQGVLEKQKFILDSEVASLERELADYCGTQYAIGCASGTDALLLSLLAAGVQPGDEVITTSYSFFSTAGMIAYLHAKPVFVDIDPATFNMDVAQVRARVTSRTRAIVAVHLFGQCCRIEELYDLNVAVIEDAAQAIGSRRNSRPAGSFGLAGCVSFFPTKNLGGYGDGGLITTNDVDFAGKIRRLRAHGEDPSRKYFHTMIGTNSRLDELQAAVLRVKLRHLASWNAKRNENARYYRTALAQTPVELPAEDSGNECTYHQFVIRTEKRDALKNWLQERGVQTAIYYPVPLPLQPCFAASERAQFPNAARAAQTSLALPIYPELGEDKLEYITSAIRTFFA